MNKGKNIIIAILSIVIIALIGCFVYLVYADKITFKKEVEQVVKKEKKVETLSEDEAIEIGKKLYDKATEAYSINLLRPYCGEESINVSNTETFGYGSYYKTRFKNVDELEEHLKTWFSDKISKKLVEGEAVTDISILKNPMKEYTNYVIQNGILYCRANVGKGWLNAYLNQYDINTVLIGENKVVYKISSYYINNYASQASYEGKTQCSVDTPEKCTDNEKEVKDTLFVIEKNSSDNWVVSDFALHE